MEVMGLIGFDNLLDLRFKREFKEGSEDFSPLGGGPLF